MYLSLSLSDEFQIEREKADLSVQVISLSERLEESEGGVESHVTLNLYHKIFKYLNYKFQFEVTRKRDVELSKLRKLLEDVHLESEETAHLLKKKHQEIVVDFNEQIESLSKAKNR